jgi:hypothetical protein
MSQIFVHTELRIAVLRRLGLDICTSFRENRDYLGQQSQHTAHRKRGIESLLPKYNRELYKWKWQFLKYHDAVRLSFLYGWRPMLQGLPFCVCQLGDH